MVSTTMPMPTGGTMTMPAGGTATQSAGGTAGAFAGRWGGRALGAAIGSIFGPAGTVAGGWIGGSVGAMAGRAAGTAIATYMEGANADAETETKDQEAAVPCEDCGDIGCFKPKKDATPEDNDEMERQLEEQQNAINEIPPDQLVKNMESYEAAGRGATDAASRATARSEWLTRTAQQLYDKGGLTKSDAAKEAASRIKTMDVIHTPDLGAGGDGTFSSHNGGLASKGVNRSIGSQWSKTASGGSGETRLQQLKKHAQNAVKSGKKSNVKLKLCEDKADTDVSLEESERSSGSSEAGSGQSDGGPPVS